MAVLGRPFAGLLGRDEAHSRSRMATEHVAICAGNVRGITVMVEVGALGNPSHAKRSPFRFFQGHTRRPFTSVSTVASYGMARRHSSRSS